MHEFQNVECTSGQISSGCERTHVGLLFLLIQPRTDPSKLLGLWTPRRIETPNTWTFSHVFRNMFISRFVPRRSVRSTTPDSSHFRHFPRNCTVDHKPRTHVPESQLTAVRKLKRVERRRKRRKLPLKDEAIPSHALVSLLHQSTKESWGSGGNAPS